MDNIFKYITANSKVLTLCLFAILLACSCEINRPSEGSKKAGEHINNVITAIAETDPVPQRKSEDSADDPAIWINAENPEESFIIGTDKKGGLATYKLDGKLLNYYAEGKMNNTDLRYNFPLNGDTIDILASSNRTNNSIALHKVTKGGILETIHFREISSQMEDVYGLCMYRSIVTGKYYVFMNSKTGQIEQWELFAKENKVDAKLVRTLNVPTQPEGMVADDSNAILYVGEEEAGIHKFNAEPEGAAKDKIIPLSSEENENIRFDIEGLTIYETSKDDGYLIASSQGNYSYAVFERQEGNKYLGSFRVLDGDIDGVEETDGIDVTNVPLGSKFPKGMFVVQDGYNYEGEELLSQNYKLISWEEIEKLFK